MIDIKEILRGDRVVLQDKERNISQGEVFGSQDGLYIKAFGVKIPFARYKSDVPKAIRGVRIVGHLPSLLDRP